MALKIDAKLEVKLALTNFHRLKNSNFILERKMAEPNQNKNLAQSD